ncbi:hypothetical protein [Acaryochloris sp. IP29b_bin.148]|uniref:hypothetical protein n=1 Tax=Acaryochloris sp. IP29b_bin.148 TaxID=2969218 RepID=UPI0026390BF3|nr:hypothetical protein [Acaryochloris sp. IP29b_bin.148]
MVRSIRTLSATLTVASTLSCSSLLLPARVSANPTNPSQIASAKYTYNPHLVRLYTYECTKKLQEVKGESIDQATQICQCSITKMQQQHPQSQAIRIFNQANAQMKTDPHVMPKELSPFFTPCISTRG